MKRISDWLHKISASWVTPAGLVIFVLFTALVLPRQASQADPSTEAVGSPDLSFFYTPEDLYEMAEVYGADGRSDYIRARLTFDVIWPLVYTVFLATAISWVSIRSFDRNGFWQRTNLVPILGMALDYLENLSTSLVMFRYPVTTPVVDFLAPFFTATKWIFVSGSFVALLAGTAKLIWDQVRILTQ